MVKIIGDCGAASLGFTPNTLSAFHEGLESADGISTYLGCSRDGQIYCIKEASRDGAQPTYDLASRLTKESAQKMGKRRLQDFDAKEINELRVKNGERIPKLEELFSALKGYEKKTLILLMRGEKIRPALKKLLQSPETQKLCKAHSVTAMAYQPADLTEIIESTCQIAPGLKFYPENFPTGLRLYPWSHKNFGQYMVFDPERIKKQDIPYSDLRYLGLEITTLRERTVRQIKRHLPQAEITLWFDNENRPVDDYALIERLKNTVIAPHIAHVLTKYPKELKNRLIDKAILSDRKRA